MKIAKLCHKPVSMFVVVAFTFLLFYWANQAPAAPAVPAPEKSSAASLENSKDEGTGVIEQEESTPVIKKGKKFPWLIVALVAVAGGAAVYFSVIKKKNYTLTVTVGEGVTGTPAAGTSTNKKGTVVSYNYSLQSGYSSLAVTLDGATVAASGTVTMNANHTLAASSTKTFVLTVSKGAHVNGNPASGTYSYARGTNVPYSYAPESGYSNLEVKLDNVAAANAGTIAMDANHSLSANLKGATIVVNSTPAGARIYMDKVDSGFTTSPHLFLHFQCDHERAHSRRCLRLPGTLQYGHRQCRPGHHRQREPGPGNRRRLRHTRLILLVPLLLRQLEHFRRALPLQGLPGRRFADYLSSFLQRRLRGNRGNEPHAGGRLCQRNFPGHQLQPNQRLRVLLCLLQQWPIRDLAFPSVQFCNGERHLYANPIQHICAIHAGLNQWNTLKIIKVGSSYTCYINNTVVHSFTDATYIPTYLVLTFGCLGTQTETRTDLVDLIPGSGPRLCFQVSR